MFGKGIYFADMVSKSANYCFASHSNPRGLLLLCEVALGNMSVRGGACQSGGRDVSVAGGEGEGQSAGLLV